MEIGLNETVNVTVHIILYVCNIRHTKDPLSAKYTSHDGFTVNELSDDRTMTSITKEKLQLIVFTGYLTHLIN